LGVASASAKVRPKVKPEPSANAELHRLGKSGPRTNARGDVGAGFSCFSTVRSPIARPAKTLVNPLSPRYAIAGPLSFRAFNRSILRLAVFQLRDRTIRGSV
jgi:hypothetical protein